MVGLQTTLTAETPAHFHVDHDWGHRDEPGTLRISASLEDLRAWVAELAAALNG